MLIRKKKAPDTGVNVISEPLSELEKIIDGAYKALRLKTVYELYLKQIFPKETFEVDKNIPNAKLVKRKLVRALAQTFSNRALFQKLMNMLPSGVLEVLHNLTWEQNELQIGSLPPSLNPPIINKDFLSTDFYDPHYSIIPENIIQIKNFFTGSIFLPDPIRCLLKQYLTPPREYFLISHDNIPKTGFLYENQNRVLSQLHLLSTYITQTHLTASERTGNISKSELLRIAKDCGIPEFYDKNAPELKAVAVHLMVDFLRRTPVEENLEPHVCLRRLFQQFFTTVEVETGFLLTRLLSHLNGLNIVLCYGNEMKEKEATVRVSLQNLLRQLTPGAWYSVQNLLNYCRYHDVMLDIVNRRLAQNALRVALPVYRDSRYIGYRHAEVAENYTDVVIIPCFKAFLFFLAAFGIADIAYDYPENKQFQKRDTKYLSVFDGLQHVRLTPLGAFVIGQTEDFVSNIRHETAQVLLDENRLLIYLDGNDPVKALLLKQFADPVCGNTYSVTYDTFLKSCKTNADIEHRFELFKNTVGRNIPRIWQDFIDGIHQKINPLKFKEELMVFEIKKHPELITLISQDELLRQYVLKAEDYHIIIHHSHLSKVVKRLETFGFFIHHLFTADRYNVTIKTSDKEEITGVRFR